MNTLNRVLDTFNLLIKNWYKIAIFCTIVVTLSIVYIFSIPRAFTSEVIMVPEVNGSSSLSGGMNSLASMAGLKLGSGNVEAAIYPEFYPKVVGTNDFLCGLLQDTIYLSEQKKKVTLIKYLTEFQDEPWWGRAFSFKNEDISKKVKQTALNPRKLTTEEEQVLRSLKSAITCFVDKRTNMVTIKSDAQDADVAAQVVSLAQKRLQQYITNYRTNKARNDLKYIEKLVSEAEAEYRAAQKKYANFADSHQELLLKSVQQEEVALDNKMQIAYNAYSQSMQQLKLAQAMVQERTPVFTILQAASIPTKPSAPKRVIFVALMALLSFLGSVVWIIGKDILDKNKGNKGNEPYASDLLPKTGA